MTLFAILVFSVLFIVLGATLALPAAFSLAVYGEAKCRDGVHRAIAWGVMCIVTGVLLLIISLQLL